MANVWKRTWTCNGKTSAAWRVTYRDPRTGRPRARQFKLKEAAEVFLKRAERAEQMARAEKVAI